MPTTVVVSADDLVGDAVVSSEGEELGRIEHIVIELRTGRVAYALLSLSGTHEAKWVAIPWGALELAADGSTLVFDSARERLERAPGIDPQHLPKMVDRAWEEATHSHFDVVPYWDGVDLSAT